MKKGVSILVAAICLIAVAFVTIFGTRPQGIVPVVYISSLTIKPSDNSKYWTNSSGMHQCYIEYDPNKEIYDGEAYYMPYIFVTEILPQNTTNRSFIYTISEQAKDYMRLSDGDKAASQGAFLLKRHNDRMKDDPMIVTVNVTPQDGGSGKGDTLYVVIDYDKVYGYSDEPPVF